MSRRINTGAQSFERVRANNNFYVDKTRFVTEWWKKTEDVTLIFRPRRFGKTLNLDTLRCFLSTQYCNRGEELFLGLDVWNDPGMRSIPRNGSGYLPVLGQHKAIHL